MKKSTEIDKKAKSEMSRLNLYRTLPHKAPQWCFRIRVQAEGCFLRIVADTLNKIYFVWFKTLLKTKKNIAMHLANNKAQ